MFFVDLYRCFCHPSNILYSLQFYSIAGDMGSFLVAFEQGCRSGLKNIAVHIYSPSMKTLLIYSWIRSTKAICTHLLPPAWKPDFFINSLYERWKPYFFINSQFESRKHSYIPPAWKPYLFTNWKFAVRESYQFIYCAVICDTIYY